jgi:hypothetical protein
MIICRLMRHRIHRAVGALLAALVLLPVAACGRAASSPHVALDPTLEALRTQFNADADLTRVLMIVAPT